MISVSPLIRRIHISPDALARSPGHVQERFHTVTEALHATLALLHPLPDALVQRWVDEEGGFVVIDSLQHGFRAGENVFRGRNLQDVAWLRLALLVDDPISYLVPAGYLIARIIGWNQPDARKDQRWRDFERGVRSGHVAGYVRSEAARADVTAYLAEGIAWYLVDARGLNIADPRLHKLLRATVFSETFWEI